MQKINFKKYYFIIFLLFLFFQVFPASAYNLISQGGANTISKPAGYSGFYGTPSDFITAKIVTIIAIVLSFVGAIFLILIIYGGYMWMTARGNDTQVAKARTVMTEAVIGLIIVVTAYAITMFLGTFITF